MGPLSQSRYRSGGAVGSRNRPVAGNAIESTAAVMDSRCGFESRRTSASPGCKSVAQSVEQWPQDGAGQRLIWRMDLFTQPLPQRRGFFSCSRCETESVRRVCAPHGAACLFQGQASRLALGPFSPPVCLPPSLPLSLLDGRRLAPVPLVGKFWFCSLMGSSVRRDCYFCGGMYCACRMRKRRPLMRPRQGNGPPRAPCRCGASPRIASNSRQRLIQCIPQPPIPQPRQRLPKLRLLPPVHVQPAIPGPLALAHVGQSVRELECCGVEGLTE